MVYIYVSDIIEIDTTLHPLSNEISFHIAKIADDFDLFPTLLDEEKNVCIVLFTYNSEKALETIEMEYLDGIFRSAVDTLHNYLKNQNVIYH